MSDLPKHAVTRAAKFAALPIGYAGRAALGFGKRVGGRPAELVAAEMQARAAEQLLALRGQADGGGQEVGEAPRTV